MKTIKESVKDSVGDSMWYVGDSVWNTVCNYAGDVTTYSLWSIIWTPGIDSPQIRLLYSVYDNIRRFTVQKTKQIENENN